MSRSYVFRHQHVILRELSLGTRQVTLTCLCILSGFFFIKSYMNTYTEKGK